MNPVDDFYKCKKNYEGVSNDEWPACSVNINIDEKGDRYIRIKLYNGTFNNIDREGIESIFYMIKNYIEYQNKEITKIIRNKLKEQMESARKTVFDDFKLMVDLGVKNGNE